MLRAKGHGDPPLALLDRVASQDILSAFAGNGLRHQYHDHGRATSPSESTRSEHDRVATLLDTLAAVPDLRLVIFDTYSDLHRGEEASADDMTDTMASLVEIKHALGCGVLVVHHQRKGDGAGLDDVRGSSAIIAKTDAVFFLKQERDEEGLPSLCTLIQRKARHTAEAKPRTLRMEAEMDGETLRSFRWAITDEQPAPARSGAPATIMAKAMGLATRILADNPAMGRNELIRQLTAQGISTGTAYRVASQILKFHIPSLSRSDPHPRSSGRCMHSPPRRIVALPTAPCHRERARRAAPVQVMRA
jgi:hypothetical protein